MAELVGAEVGVADEGDAALGAREGRRDAVLPLVGREAALGEVHGCNGHNSPSALDLSVQVRTLAVPLLLADELLLIGREIVDEVTQERLLTGHHLAALAALQTNGSPSGSDWMEIRTLKDSRIVGALAV